MSQDFMDPELFADFIVEAKEHLETIEPNLLELEKTPDNLSILNEIFRPMHSLKGASGFLGLNKINVLAHRCENVLDGLRKGTMAVNSEIMDVILSSTDALRQIIDCLESSNTEGDVDTSQIIVTLDAIMAGDLHPGAAPAPAAAQAPAAVVPSAPAVPPAGSGASCPRQTGDVEVWLQTRDNLPSYELTAFGEGHLRDFIEEAKENITNLSDGLLELEKHPDAHKDMVNDLFRYFHNLKGNSGIIGFQELNSLTHEAETLLNAVRKDEYPVTTALTDLLLLVVDVLEALIFRIDPAGKSVAPFDTAELLGNLREAVAGGAIVLPASLLATVGGADSRQAASDVQHTAAAAAEAMRAEAPPVGASTVSSMDKEEVHIFQSTVAQQFVHIAAALDGMRKDGANREFADVMYRSLSTIQNCCGFMGLEEIKQYAQRTAGIVDQGRLSGLDFSIMADLLEQECAIIKDMIPASLAAHIAAQDGAGEKSLSPAVSPVAAPAASARPASPASADKAAPAAPTHPASGAKPPAKADEAGSKASATIRVDHEKLDHLMNLIGELIINRNRYSMLARQLEDSADVDIGLIAQNLSETTYAMARISDDLQDTIMKVRMVPVASVFSRFPRLVRDLSRKSGKEVELIVEGEETELDKSVVEVIGDPLVHLIRNAVDHGVEHENDRQAIGKPPKGKIWLRAFYKGNSVAIEIEDDGKGIDPEKMREVAVRKNVISPEEAKLLDDRESMELIFAPGFSSAEVITDISGRGVGMDVVRTNIKNLKGSISIASEVGKGTKFTLSLPLTLAIIDALMVNVDDQMYAIPLDAVSETTKIEARRLTDVKGRKAVTLRGEVLGIVSLSELLALPCRMSEQAVLSVVVIQDNERRLGLVVDRLLERQEIVIKPLGAYLGDLKGISGATIMGDGSVILILDPHEIYALATSKAG
ncbi:MAG: chemotaxis protein CheA [Desulfovibrio sp.]|jgi:two-component system chemotaxis sensor kinase CheA|nr:chemotaxis protein CheA [Desulfovibrio sp.]